MMQLTTIDVSALAPDVDCDPDALLASRRDFVLFTVQGNPKTEKSRKKGLFTVVLHFAPWNLSGRNVCSHVTAGCGGACLNTSGHGSFDSTVHRARIRRTVWFRKDRATFGRRLEREILRAERRAAKYGLTLVVRLNGTSDIPYENVRFVWADGSESTVFARFSHVQFYDYTKNYTRFAKQLPPNYDLTMSAADGNEAHVETAQSHGARVAVVFYNAAERAKLARYWELPDTYQGRPLVDGDEHDARFLDPAGCVVGLKAKGLARFDTTGFARPIEPRGAAA